ncbi:hypothetical protein KM043_010563 [Ampulex compressa]|nr:hypothetical protein KM043_010563 [Ampulex compressa]
MFGKEVIKRWGNIRDSFVKSYKKLKEFKISSSGAMKVKKYVYSDQLQFLSKVIEERQMQDTLNDNARTRNKDSNDSIEDFKPPKKAAASRKRRKPDELEVRMLKALKRSDQPNRHMSFFSGIVPSLETLDDDEIIQFQIGVLQLIEKIKRRKRPQNFHYQSPAVAHGNYQNMLNTTLGHLAVHQLPPHNIATAIAGGPLSLQSGTNQFYTSYSQHESALSPNAYSCSDTPSPAPSTSSSNAADIIDFASV